MAVDLVLVKDGWACWSCRYFSATDAQAGKGGTCFEVEAKEETGAVKGATVANGLDFRCHKWVHTPEDVPAIP